MLQNLLGSLRQMWTSGRETEKNSGDIVRLQAQMEKFALAMERVLADQRHDRELNATQHENLRVLNEKEREILMLRLENELLKLQRQLPPPKDN